MKRLAVVVSRYPTVSHTFIRREVEALRGLGLEVQTAALRPSPESELLTAEDRAEILEILRETKPELVGGDTAVGG